MSELLQATKITRNGRISLGQDIMDRIGAKVRRPRQALRARRFRLARQGRDARCPCLSEEGCGQCMIAMDCRSGGRDEMIMDRLRETLATVKAFMIQWLTEPGMDDDLRDELNGEWK